MEDGTLDWLLACAAWLPMPWLAWLSARIHGSWLAPGALAAGVWTIAAGVPLWLAPDMPAYPTAYGLVLLFVTVCVVASAMGANAVAFVPTRATSWNASWRAMGWRIYTLGLVVGSLAPIVLYQETKTFTRGASLSEIAMYASMARYGGEYTIPFSVRLLTCVTYLSATMAAFLTASTPPHERKWARSLAWLAPLAASLLVHTAKANVLYGLVLWAGAWSAGIAFSRLNTSRAVARKSSPRIVLAVVAVVSLVLLLVLSQALRMNRLSLSDLPFLLNHLRHYVVGHMPVFGHWAANTFPGIPADGLGMHTFAGFAELAGVAERQKGLYAATADFTDSNIYTAWRPLLEDFGVFGGVLFLFVLAYFAGMGWRLLERGRLVGATFVMIYASYTVWSPITSIFVYSLLFAVMLLFAAFTWWADGPGRAEALRRRARTR
jgi:hypothetical protein